MRIADARDLPALTALWHTCFGDPPEWIGGFWRQYFSSITVFTDETRDAMALALPVRWQERDAAYFYAVCTAPAARGQGRCRTLLREAEAYLRAHGCAFALLVPAEESLFRYYAALGYENAFFCSHREFHAAAAAPAVPVSAARYAQLRAQYAPPHAVVYPPQLLALQASLGCLLEIPGLGCAAVEQPDGLVRELLSASPQAAADAVAAFLGTEMLTAQCPGDMPFGMAKPLGGAALQRGYLAFPFG